MAWTAPSTFVAGAILTAAQMNSNVRDNSLAGGPIYATTAARDAAIPTPFAGQRAFVTATNVNYQYNGTAWVSPQALSVPPLCRANQTGNTSIANNTTTAMPFNAENYDTDGMHSTTSNTTRLTVVTAGVYALTAQVTWDINNTGIRVINLRLNGATNIAFCSQTNNGASNFTEMTVSTQYSLAAADYVEATVYQNAGGPLNARGDVTNGVWICAAFVGKTA
jgi:hypothetical protein